MMTSATYRQSSTVTPSHEQSDPDNVLSSRMPLQRLDAEALYDAMLLVAGRLDDTRYGPSDPLEARADGLVTPAGTAKGWRRSVYVRQERKQVSTFHENFDLPAMNPNCIERRNSTVTPQALHMMNNGMIHQLAEQFAQRVRREARTDPQRQIEHAYLIALSRTPSDEEKEIGLTALAKLTDRWAKQFAGPERDAAAMRALATVCHALVNSAGFIYVD